MKRFLRIGVCLGLLAFLSLVVVQTQKKMDPVQTFIVTGQMPNTEEPQAPFWSLVDRVSAQATNIIKRFRSNSAGIDTVAQDSAVNANAKLFTVGSRVSGTPGLSAYGTMYYDRILYFLEADTLSTNDTLHISFVTHNYQDSVFRIPFTYCNGTTGAETADAESLAVSAAGRFVFMVNGNSSNSFGPLRNVSMKVRVNPTSAARCIYKVSAQYNRSGAE